MKTVLRIRDRQCAFGVDEEVLVVFRWCANFKWLDLSDLAEGLRKRKWFLLSLTVISSGVALVTVLFLPVRYVGVAEILPVPPDKSLYVGLLRSRTIADAIIHRFDLQDVYHSKDMTATREKLARQTEIRPEKNGSITIRVEDSDKARAKSLADAYAEELQNFINHLIISDALQRLLFYEHQLKEAQSALSGGELRLVQERNKTGSLVGSMAGTDSFVNENRQKHASALHEMRYRLGLYKICAKQYEEARLAELDFANSNSFRVVEASFPGRNLALQRELSVSLSGLCGFLVASFIVTVQRWREWIEADPTRWVQLELLRKAMARE